MNSKTTTLILVAICAILGNLIYYKYKNPLDTEGKTSTPSSEKLLLKESPEATSLKLGDVNNFEAIVERPLFSHNRQPQEESAIEIIPVQKTPVKKPDLQLTGIVLSDDEQVALIKVRKNPRLKRVKLNEKVQGWTLIELKSNSAKLTSGDQELVLELNRKGNSVKARQLTDQQKNQQNLKQRLNQITGKQNTSTPTGKPIAPAKQSPTVEEGLKPTFPPSRKNSDD